VCEDESTNRLDPDDDSLSQCPRCSPPHYFRTGAGGEVLAHIGAHLLFDKTLNRSQDLCGLCLRPAPLCKWVLKKARGGGTTIDFDKSVCPNMVNFNYQKAAVSKESSPCSNVPLRCPVCSFSDPKAQPVWKYNLDAHFDLMHPSVDKDSYSEHFHLTPFEHLQMKKCWKARKSVKKCKGKLTKNKPARLKISEAHSTRLGLRYASDSPSNLINGSTHSRTTDLDTDPASPSDVDIFPDIEAYDVIDESDELLEDEGDDWDSNANASESDAGSDLADDDDNDEEREDLEVNFDTNKAASPAPRQAVSQQGMSVHFTHLPSHLSR
jgi:hypothetical protein